MKEWRWDQRVSNVRPHKSAIPTRDSFTAFGWDCALLESVGNLRCYDYDGCDANPWASDQQSP